MFHVSIINAFTDSIDGGNPAGVCRVDAFPDAGTMQAVAAEIGLSETAFLVERDADGFDLRWFTPAVEVELCGHATLAAAHHLGSDPLRFHTRSGPLCAEREGDWITLDFPALGCEACTPPAGVLAALGVEPVAAGRNRMDLLIEVESEAVLRAIQPAWSGLMGLERGVIVTCASGDAAYDFVSRFFAPAAGVNEDPVTGSAHCCLGPYWRDRLGRDILTGYQASLRGGVVRVACRGDRVMLSGQAIEVTERSIP